MRFILILFIQLTLYAQNYNFDEIKYISAVSHEFKKSGNINIEEEKTIITYSKPSFKEIIKDNENVSIKDSSGKIYKLKGRAKVFTQQFIDIMTRLGNIDEMKTNKDFDVKKEDNLYYITFLEDISNQIKNAEVKVKNSKVISFKMFLPNEDTIEIIKK
ncbi:hypothetical protein [Poseidonibacter antarcticus]|uniref:hypothetical protein n=1 Tax=Poseidonibacter antarcticus TaxID=2478538 RepID=UPI000EF52CE5|nr:hypothetical protein [Poseidonibacter antarcticus]